MLPEVPRNITRKSVNFLHAHIKYTLSSFIGNPPKFINLLEMALLDSFQVLSKTAISLVRLLCNIILYFVFRVGREKGW